MDMFLEEKLLENQKNSGVFSKKVQNTPDQRDISGIN